MEIETAPLTPFSAQSRERKQNKIDASGMSAEELIRAQEEFRSHENYNVDDEQFRAGMLSNAASV
jgi:hypothetical protein